MPDQPAPERQILRSNPQAQRLVAAAVAAGTAATATVVVQAWCIGATVDGVFRRGQTLDDILPWLLVLAAATVARALLAGVQDVAGQAAAGRVKTDLRQRLGDHLAQTGPSQDAGAMASGALVHTYVEEIEALDEYVAAYLPARWLALLATALIFVSVFILDPVSTLVLVFAGPLLVLLLVLIGQRTRQITDRRFGELSWMSAHFLDMLQGLTTLKVFGRSREQVENIAAISNHFGRTTMDVLRTAFQTSLVLELGATAATALVALEIGLRVMGDSLPFNRALAVLILTPEFFLPLRRLALHYHAGAAGKAAVQRILALLERPQTADHGPQPVVSGAQPGQAPGVRFEHVTYTYPTSGHPAVHDLTLELAPGETLALVGATGAGKSTVMHLLLGFLKPSGGAIRIGDADLASLDPASWRNQVAWVPQRPYLFHGSVAENIRLAAPDATDDAMVAAAVAANAHDFITGLPQGYDTPIGDMGVRLSGGQRQRLAIARAFLANRPLLLMDEPTSHLDAESEVLVLEAMERLVHGRTVLIIAHSLRWARRAGRVALLDNGRLVARGTHADLLASCEPYRRLAGAAGRTPDCHAEHSEASPARPQTLRSAQSDSRSNVLYRLLALLAPYRWWVAFSILLSFGALIAGVGLMAVSAYLISKSALVTSIADLALAIAGVRLFALSRAGLRYAERYVTHRTTFRLLSHLRVWFYRGLEPLAPAGLLQRRRGDLLAGIVADIETLEHFFVRVVTPPAAAVLVAVLTCLLLAAFDPRLGLALLTFLILAGVVLPWLTARLSRAPGTLLVAARAELSARMLDQIQGRADLLIFDQAGRRRTGTLETGHRLVTLQQRLARVRGLGNGLSALLTGFAALTVLALAIPLVTDGRIEGVFLALLPLAAIASFEAVQPLPQAWQMLGANRAAASRLFEIIDAPTAVTEPVAPAAPPDRHDLEIENLHFRYAPDEPEVLSGVSLCIPTGGRLALVGASGAGKTTLVNLLLRFWDYERGSIRLGGVELADLAADDVRSLISVVSQDTYLFNTSLRDNLLLAAPDADDDALLAACRIAQLEPFIADLPAGLDTPVGENGLRLSGGERQRVAIARVLLKAAPVLILDEAAAHLDALTEQRLWEAMGPFLAGRTTLIISHHPPERLPVDVVVHIGTRD